MKLLRRLTGKKETQETTGGMGVPLKKKQSPANKAAEGKKKLRFKMPGIMPGRSLGYLLAALLLIGVSVYGANYLTGNATIQQITVSGNMLTDSKAIILVAHTEPGTPADSVRALELIERVEAMPYVRRAEVYISRLGRMQILVSERQPIGILVKGNAMTMVDADGIKMAIPDHHFPNVPLLYGFDPNAQIDTLQSNKFNKVAAFLQQLEKKDIAMLTISEVGWHAEEGIFALSRENGVRLVFGDDDFTTRLGKWEEFYRQVVPQKGMAGFLSLDFRFNNQIVARET